MTNASQVSDGSPSPAFHEVVDSPSAAVLELFRGALADVRFPNVDGESLETAASEVMAKAAEVARLRAELSAAQEVLGEAQAALRAQARQGHAYAKVYAAEDQELSGLLEAISFEPAKSRATKKPRSRKAKAVAKTPQLRLEDDDKKEMERAAS